MSTTALSIQNEDSAWEYIKTALDGKYDRDVVELNFENWPVFRINVKGNRYDSTMTTSMMKSLVELQSHLNRVYAEIVHHKTAKSLTSEERDALEIVFKVEKGSSNIVADLSGFFTELGRSAMEKMTGRQVVGLVVGVATLFVAGSAYKNYLDLSQKSAEESHKHEITMALIKQQPQLLKIQSDNEVVYTNLLKSVSDADQVELDKATFTNSQLAEISRTERQSTELTRLDNEYLISALKIKADRYKIEIIRQSDERAFATELFKGHLSIDEMQSIAGAFMTERPINLNVLARVRGEAITMATIVGVNNLAKGTEVSSVSTGYTAFDDLDLSSIELDSPSGDADVQVRGISGPSKDPG